MPMITDIFLVFIQPNKIPDQSLIYIISLICSSSYSFILVFCYTFFAKKSFCKTKKSSNDTLSTSKACVDCYFPFISSVLAQCILSSNKFISDAFQGLDVFVSYLFTKFPYMYINGTITNDNIVTPYQVKYFFATKYFFRFRHQ